MEGTREEGMKEKLTLKNGQMSKYSVNSSWSQTCVVLQVLQCDFSIRSAELCVYLL